MPDTIFRGVGLKTGEVYFNNLPWHGKENAEDYSKDEVMALMNLVDEIVGVEYVGILPAANRARYTRLLELNRRMANGLDEMANTADRTEDKNIANIFGAFALKDA